MNRCEIKLSTEGACGDMYRQAARGRCVEQVDVQYMCKTEMSKNITQHKIHMMEKREEDTSKQMQHQVQGGRNGEVDMEAPVWWMLEVERHSSNPRNKNRIRKKLEEEARWPEKTDKPPSQRT